MLPRRGQSHTTARSTTNQALTHQVRLSNRLHCLGLFTHRNGEGRQTHRAAAELVNQRLQHGAVQAVQAARIHLVHVQRGCGITRIDAVHAVHQRPVTHTAQQTVRNTRRAAGTTGNLRETLGGNLHVHQTRAAAKHQFKLLHRVELQVTGKTEAVTQRPGQQTRTGRRTDQSELRQLQRNGGRARTLTDHNVHTEIFHRHVEHFLSRAAHTVNLIQEQHLTGSQ